MRTNTDHIEDMYVAEKRRARDAVEERDNLRDCLERERRQHTGDFGEILRLRAERDALIEMLAGAIEGSPDPGFRKAWLAGPPGHPPYASLADAIKAEIARILSAESKP